MSQKRIRRVMLLASLFGLVVYLICQWTRFTHSREDHTHSREDHTSVPANQELQQTWSRCKSGHYSCSEDGERPQHTQTSGYIAVLLFEEQMESALNDLYRLISVSSPWRMQLVEPLVTKWSFGMAKVQGKNQLRFSDLFNLTRVNQQFQQCLGVDYPPIASFEEFISQDVSTAIKVVAFLPYVDNLESPTGFFGWFQSKVNEVICLVVASVGVMAYMPHTPKDYRTKAFCVNSAQRVNFGRVFQLVLGTEQYQTATVEPRQVVVIPTWSGITATPSKSFHWDPDYVHRTCPVHRLEPSNAVNYETSLFVHKLHLTDKPYLGIHLRLERLIRDDEHSTKECVQKLITAAMAIKEEYQLGSDDMVAFTDYGSYGSMTCVQVNCIKVAQDLQIANRLGALGVRIVEYSPQGPKQDHHTFIASVERDVLASSSYLLVGGWGSFQRAVVEKFLVTHSRDKFYSVCSTVYGENFALQS